MVKNELENLVKRCNLPGVIVSAALMPERTSVGKGIIYLFSDKLGFGVEHIVGILGMLLLAALLLAYVYKKTCFDAK